MILTSEPPGPKVGKEQDIFRPIFARKLFDITWQAILRALYYAFVWRQAAEHSVKALEALWAPQQTLVALTVRSGFDLCLQACAFPPGSEVIVSAVTIPDMVRIITLHKLVPVPVDLQDDGSVSADDISRLITPKTKAILIAQLFGARKSLATVAKVGRNRGLLIIEDCAQTFCGRQFVGSTDVDISMFSFGPIKTCTALGGALLTVRNPALLQEMQSIQTRHPRQSNSRFLQRVGKYTALKVLTDSPYIYGLFITALRLLGKNHHRVVTQLSHSLAPENLLKQIRFRPAAALLQLLYHRVAHFHAQDLEPRKARVSQFAAMLQENLQPLGYAKEQHHFWICPVRVRRPDLLVGELFDAGFDAADGGTSLGVVSASGMEQMTPQACKMMREIIYVPIDHAFSSQELFRLAKVFREHHERYSD